MSRPVTPALTPIHSHCDAPSGELGPLTEQHLERIDILAHVSEELRGTCSEVLQLLQSRHQVLLKDLAEKFALKSVSGLRDLTWVTDGSTPNFLVNKEYNAEARAEDKAVSNTSSADYKAVGGIQQLDSMNRDTLPPEQNLEVQLDGTHEMLRSESIKKGNSDSRVARSRSGSGVQLRSNVEPIYLNKHGTLLRLEKLVTSAWFESAFALLIVINALANAMEAQYIGIGNGYTVGVPGYAHTKEDVWPWADVVFRIMSLFFGGAFALEILMKIPVLRTHFFFTGWNVLDLMIVGAWLAETALTFQGSVKVLPVNPSVLRVARLFRLLRLMRLVKTIQLFDVLRLMVGSLAASAHVCFWSFLFLFFLMLTSGLTLGVFLESYITDEARSEADKIEMFMHFGTFSRSLLSMFELTLGNWVPLTRLLNDKVSEWFCPVLLAYHCVVAFAIMTVIRGIFLHETFQVAAADDELMIMKKERQIRKTVTKMNQLFLEADESGDGYLSEAEFYKVMDDVRVKTWLAAMELEVRDADLLFKLMDDGDKHISANELVRGFSKLKGPARSVDMVSCMHDNKTETKAIQDRITELGHKIDNLEYCHRSCKSAQKRTEDVVIM